MPDDGFRDQALLVSSPDAALATASGFLTLFWGVLGDLVSMAPDKVSVFCKDLFGQTHDRQLADSVVTAGMYLTATWPCRRGSLCLVSHLSTKRIRF